MSKETSLVGIGFIAVILISILFLNKKGISEWINSNPLSEADLKGKVVLVDFWTYSCINCIRTLPHLNEWHKKYKDNGLIILGVH